MLFISDSDSEYDNVYWVTGDNQVYITDMGARTRKTESTVQFENPPINIHRIPAETLQPIKRLGREAEMDNTGGSENKIATRFKILLIITGVLLLIGFIYHGIDFVFSLKTYLLVLVGVTVWFGMDYRALQVVRFYNLAFILAAALVFYGYFFAFVNPSPQPHEQKPKDWIFTFFPLIFLSVQKPIRHIFKSILGREPVVGRPMPAFADFIYFILLWLVSGLVLLAIVFLIK